MSAVPARRPSVTPPATETNPASVATTGRRNAQTYGVPTQRDRLVAAMGELTAELGLAAVGVHHVCQRAGVSRRTFYELYADRDACVVDTHDEAFGRLLAHLAEAVADAGAAWEDRAVAVTAGAVQRMGRRPGAGEAVPDLVGQRPR